MSPEGAGLRDMVRWAVVGTHRAVTGTFGLRQGLAGLAGMRRKQHPHSVELGSLFLGKK